MEAVYCQPFRLLRLTIGLLPFSVNPDGILLVSGLPPRILRVSERVTDQAGHLFVVELSSPFFELPGNPQFFKPILPPSRTPFFAHDS